MVISFHKDNPVDKSTTLRVSLPEVSVYQVNIDGVDYLVNSRGGIVKK